MGIWWDRHSSLTASAFSFCAFPSGGWRHAVLATKVFGCADSRPRSPLFDSCLLWGALWKAHPPLFLSIPETSASHTDRLGGRGRNSFADPVSSLQVRIQLHTNSALLFPLCTFVSFVVKHLKASTTEDTKVHKGNAPSQFGASTAAPLQSFLRS